MSYRRYVVVIEKGPKSYGAFVPDLPGCVAAAKTRARVVKLIREAMALHLEDMQSRGEPPPPGAAEAESIEVAV